MTLRVRRQTESGDMLFGRGAATFLVDSREAVAQILGTRLWLFEGEWFLDSRVGMPWLTKMVGYRTQRLADSVLRTYIAGSPGVLSVVKYSSNLDRTTRRFTVDVTVDTIFGITRLVQELGLAPDVFTLDQSPLGGDAPLA